MSMDLFARIRRTELISPFFEASKSSWLPKKFTQSMNVIRKSLQNRNFRMQLDTNRELK